MKRIIVTVLLGLMIASWSGAALAVPDEYDDSQSEPLRVAAYLVYPVGYTLEWLIFRPLHYIVSRPQLEQVFGHHPHNEVGTYR